MASGSASGSEPGSGRRVAYLIGQKYEADNFPRLPHTSNDVRALRELLMEKCDFEEVEVWEDVTREGFETLKRSFVKSVGGFPNSLFLLYYGGHGYSGRFDSVLVPADATSATEVAENPVSLNGLLQPLHDSCGGADEGMERTAMDTAGKKPAPGTEIIVVWDACRKWLLDDASGRIHKELSQAKKLRPRTTELCFVHACDPGDVALEDDSAGHGRLTKAFIDAIERKPGRNFSQVCEDVVKTVKKQSKGRQRPWISHCSPNLSSLILNKRTFRCFGLSGQEILAFTSQAAAALADPCKRAVAIFTICCCLLSLLFCLSWIAGIGQDVVEGDPARVGIVGVIVTATVWIVALVVQLASNTDSQLKPSLRIVLILLLILGSMIVAGLAELSCILFCGGGYQLVLILVDIIVAVSVLVVVKMFGIRKGDELGAHRYSLLEITEV